MTKGRSQVKHLQNVLPRVCRPVVSRRAIRVPPSEGTRIHGSRYGRRNFRPNCFSAENFFGRLFFSWGGLGGRSRSFHFKKFAKANFLKWCRGGVWGGLPPSGISATCALPPAGVWGASPSRNLRYPRLASAATMPCPRALPPIFFRPNFFVGIFFVRRRSVVRPSLPVDLATGRCADGEKSENELQASYRPKNLTI